MKINSLKKHSLKAAVIAACLLITLSLITIVPTLYFKYTDKGTVAFKTVQSKTVVKPTPGVPVISGQPVNISVPSVNVNTNIVDGYYNSKTKAWNVGLSVAQYVPETTLPNDLRGNTYIYGHYRPAVFAYLHHIVPGSTATITTANGYLFTYKYVSTYATAPNDTAILLGYQGPPILTVQTCSGSFFQNRQFYVFDYVSYQKLDS